ncbi:phage head closure protein [Mesobacillus zeae]|uniref:Head-tail adaptor protein n=1 Tax=Mesobacillus zeae TaxID=1917180 RepID=A0A398BD14_9BACI|nr:phage head closure protein [Mesobacillus zeae]RID85670.1 head-tail adaptor protein [Mesobacillus zeae]
MVTIQRVTTVSNGFGGYIETWTNHIENYGTALDQLSGNEFVKADKTFPGSTHILIGDIADITENDRVLLNNEQYDIKNVDNPMNMDRHLEILLEYKGAVT